MVLPTAGEPHFGKLIDLEMLVLSPRGRERTEDEFRSLLAAAGLRFVRVVATGGFSAIVEAARP